MLDETLTDAEVAARLAGSERLAGEHRYGDPWPAELPVAGYPELWWRFGLGYGGYRLAIRGTRHDLRHVILDRRADEALPDAEWVRAYAAEYGHSEDELWACLRYTAEQPAEVEAQIERFLTDNEAAGREREGWRLFADVRAPYGRTKSGRPLDDDLVAELALEAERGYDVKRLKQLDRRRESPA